MITLDLTPQEEAQIEVIARRTGIAPAEYVKNLIKSHLPAAAYSSPPIDSENSAAISLLQSWMSEEATDDPVAICQAEAEASELLQNLNRNRVENGERPLFP